MKQRFNVFLTIFLGSVLIGMFLVYEISPGFDSSLSTIEDLDVGEDRVTIATSCFKLDLNASRQQVSQINKFYGSNSQSVQSPYNLAVRMAEASGNSIEYVEINSPENRIGAELILDDVKSTRVNSNPVDAVIVAANQDIPVVIEKELIRERGDNICLSGSIEI